MRGEQRLQIRTARPSLRTAGRSRPRRLLSLRRGWLQQALVQSPSEWYLPPARCWRRILPRGSFTSAETARCIRPLRWVSSFGSGPDGLVGLIDEDDEVDIDGRIEDADDAHAKRPTSKAGVVEVWCSPPCCGELKAREQWPNSEPKSLVQSQFARQCRALCHKPRACGGREPMRLVELVQAARRMARRWMSPPVRAIPPWLLRRRSTACHRLRRDAAHAGGRRGAGAEARDNNISLPGSRGGEVAVSPTLPSIS